MIVNQTVLYPSFSSPKMEPIKPITNVLLSKNEWPDFFEKKKNARTAFVACITVSIPRTCGPIWISLIERRRMYAQENIRKKP